MMDHRLLGVYLNNHLTGATGGVEMFRRVAQQHAGSDRGVELTRLADEVAADRDTLLDIMRRLEVSQNKALTSLGWLGEKAGRLKPNGYVLRRSPLSDVVELEALRVAVAAKHAGWQILRAVAVHDSRVTRQEVERLLERAEDQSERLYKLHLRVAEEQLSEADR